MTRRLIVDRVRVESIGMARRGVITEERTIVRFTFSADIIAELFRLHDSLFLPFVYGKADRPERYKAHRLEFARFRDIGIPAVLVRIEAPTYDPHGQRFSPPAHSRQFRCQILARKLRVLPNISSKILETMWMPDKSIRGLMLTFPDEDMEYPGEKTPLTPRQKPIPVNNADLTVR